MRQSSHLREVKHTSRFLGRASWGHRSIAEHKQGWARMHTSHGIVSSQPSGSRATIRLACGTMYTRYGASFFTFQKRTGSLKDRPSTTRYHLACVIIVERADGHGGDGER